MTTEELKIKISALIDTGSFNQAKKEINEFTKGTEDAAVGTRNTAAAMEDLADTVQVIATLRMGELIKKSLSPALHETKKLKEEFIKLRIIAKSSASGIKDNLKEGLLGQYGFSRAKDAMLGLQTSFLHLQDYSDQLKETLKQLGVVATTALSNIAKAAGVAAAAFGLLVWNSLHMSSLAKQTNVLAQQAGMTTDSYQRWAFVLGQVGLQVDDMIGAQQTLLEAQVDVRDGAEDMIAAFKQIGLTQEEVLGMNQQQLFERTVEGLQGLDNSTQRATVALKLLSEDSKNLAPLLNLTSQEVALLAGNFNELNGAMSEGLIESSNRLQASVGNLKAAWQGLRNTLSEVILPVVVKLVDWLTRAIVIVNLFVRTIFGLDIGGAASKGVENATSGVEGYKESVDKATGSVNKLKRTLMGFDELNVLHNPNTSSSGSDAGSSGGAGGFAGGITDSLFSAGSLDFSKYTEWFSKYKTLIQDITTWGLIGVGTLMAVIGAMTGNLVMVSAGLALAGIGFSVGNADGGTFDRLKQKLEGTIFEIVPTAMVGIGALGAVWALLHFNIPAAIAFGAMAGIGLSLGGGSSIKSFINKYGDEIIGVVAPSMIAIGAIGAGLALMFANIPLAASCLSIAGIGLSIGSLGSGGIGKFVSKYKDEIKTAITVATAGASALACMMCMLTGNVPGAIAFGALAGISLSMLAPGSFYSDSIKGISKTLSEARTAIINGWNNIKSYFNENIAPKFTKQYWLNKYDSIKSSITTKIGETRTAMINGWNNIRSYYNTSIAPKFTTTYWANKFDTVRSAASDKMNAVRTTIINAWNNTRKYFNENISPKFTVSYWKTKFDTIKNGAKSAFNGVIAIVEKAVNNIIAKINTLSWKIPDWVPKVGGKSFGFNFKSVSIPRLATGGIATRSTIANIGEAGREAVLPLDNNTGWMDMLADRIASRNQTPTKLVLKVGERELGWATINGINQITKQTGELQLTI